MNKDFRLAFDILDKVFREGAYSNVMLSEVLDKTDNRALVTRLVYGTLERNVTLEYYMSSLCAKRPCGKVAVIIKLGLFMLKFMHSLPPYAVVNEMVNLTTYVKKPKLSGFVNATLKLAADKDFELPKDDKQALSVTYSVPLWLVKCLIKQYGRDVAINIMGAKSDGAEHIRANHRLISDAQLSEKLDSLGVQYRISEQGGFFVKNTTQIRQLFDDGVITYQSPSSMLVCAACGVADGDKVLDMCASPGGKSIYLDELACNLDILACDIHPERVRKIEEYAARMSAHNVKAICRDGSVHNEEFDAKFDLVLCDAPCSGLGVAAKKPDIYLNKTFEDVLSLSEVQYKLLNNAINYAKKGGHIVYSTCTILREENYNIVGRILKERSDVELEVMPISIPNKGYVQLLPTDGVDGFFIARLKKC